MLGVVVHDRDLVVHPGVDRAVDDLQHAGGVGVERHQLRLGQVLAAVLLAGGGDAHGEPAPVRGEVSRAAHGRVLGGEDGEAGAHVRFGEVDRLPALFVGGERGDDQVDLAALQRGNEAVEVHVAELDRLAEAARNRLADGDADPADAAFGVDEFERRVGGVEADDEDVAPGAAEQGEAGQKQAEAQEHADSTHQPGRGGKPQTSECAGTGPQPSSARFFSRRLRRAAAFFSSPRLLSRAR